MEYRLMITAKRLRSRLHYNPETGVFTWTNMPGRAGPGKRGRIAGSIRKSGHREIGIDGRQYPAGSLAWLYMHGRWPPRRVDHENNEPDDNRFTNLRLATVSQNMQNSRRRSDNKSGHKGVTWHAARKKWAAKITVDGRQIFLGHFDTAEAAGAARRKAAKKYHRAYARYE